MGLPGSDHSTVLWPSPQRHVDVTWSSPQRATVAAWTPSGTCEPEPSPWPTVVPALWHRRTPSPRSGLLATWERTWWRWISAGRATAPWCWCTTRHSVGPRTRRSASRTAPRGGSRTSRSPRCAVSTPARGRSSAYAGERVPGLEEVLAVLRGSRSVAPPRAEGTHGHPGAGRRTSRRSYACEGAADRVVVQSFDACAMRSCTALRPDVTMGVLGRAAREELRWSPSGRVGEPVAAAARPGVRRGGAPVGHGLPGVDRRPAMGDEPCSAAGVDGVITNRPSVARGDRRDPAAARHGTARAAFQTKSRPWQCGDLRGLAGLGPAGTRTASSACTCAFVPGGHEMTDLSTPTPSP